MENLVGKRVVNSFYHLPGSFCLPKSLGLFLLFNCFLVFPALATSLQNVRISLNRENITLNKVLDEIEQQTGYSFLVRSDDVNTQEIISIHVHNKTVEDVLSELFGNRQIKYMVEGKKISIYKPRMVAGTASTLQTERNITGVVTDENGEPIIGANVVVKGTTIGNITDVDGKYSIHIPESASILSISYIGYAPKEVVIGKQEVINVRLAENMQRIDEVVVVGYGTQKRRDLTGSVASLDNTVITKQNTSNATSALRGQIAGLSVQQTSGQAGATSTVILRGQSAIKKTVQPLVIIDGIPSGWDVLNDMAPDDIERLDVLKDASSTAIYGSRASGGVIIVTTRAGRESKNVVSYSGSVGIKKLTRNPEMMNTQQFQDFYQAGVAYRGEPQDNKIMADDLEYIERGINTNWLDFIARDGMQTSHNVSLSGGNQHETHYMSFGYYKESGIQKSDDYERFSLNARVTGKVINKLMAGAALYASYATKESGDQNMLNSAYRLRPWGNPYNDDGTYRFFPTVNESGFVNPVFDLENTYNQEKRIRVRGSVFIEYKPVEGFTLKSNFMPNYNMSRNGTYTGEMTRENSGKAGTSKSSATNKWGIGYIWENTLAYNKKLGEDHSVGLTGLFSLEDGINENYSGTVQNLSYPDEYWYNLGAATSINALTSGFSQGSMISYMGRINYGFKDKYLLTLTGRRDGSSRLASGNKWGFFPSAALAWRAGEEEFIKNLHLFSNLKLRLSYGVAGNNAVDAYSSFSTLNTTIYAWDETPAKGSAAKMSNKNLSWEKSYEYNLGLDVGFFDERLSAVIDLYHKTTKDLILSRNIPSHQGITSLNQNVGSVRNKGVEVSVNSVNIQHKDFTWITNLNFSANKNEILELYGDKTDDLGNSLFIGYPVNVSYDYKFQGIWQSSEEDEALKYGSRPGYVKIYDKDGSGTITPEGDKMILGDPFPSWTGGITNTFTYKDFDLSFFIYTRQGEFKKSAFHNDLGTLHDTRYNVLQVPYWTPENPSNRWWSPGSTGTNVDKSSYMDVSFWRVGHITLGYDFNQEAVKKAGFSKLRVYLQVNNPFVFTQYDGWDPEWAESGTDKVPLNGVTYMTGVNVSF